MYDDRQRLAFRQRPGQVGCGTAISAAIAGEVQMHLVRWHVATVGIEFEVWATWVSQVT